MRSTSLLAVCRRAAGGVREHDRHVIGQTATGQITGTVRDATGAVMAGVKVVVTNEQTGLTRQTTTGANGEYVIPLLPVGVYVVTGEQTGFKTAIHSTCRAHGRPDPAGRHAARPRERDARPSKSSRTRSCSIRQRLGRPHDYREAGHRAAAQRPQLPAAAVPRRRRGGDRRRTGRDAARRGQRDQHHGRAARRRTTS